MTHHGRRLWTMALLGICFAYFLFEFFYVHYAGLVADEFTFARQIYDYTRAIPYRDFPPYKSVLGNYLLAPAMLFSHDIITPLLYIKTEIAIFNALLLFFCAYWAARIFDYRAVVLTTLAILANQHFLLLSADLRVDMLASWLSLLAGLAMLTYRPRLSGTIMGIAFLVSQKTLWYIIATNGAVTGCFLLGFAKSAQPNLRPTSDINNRHFTWRTLLSFNLNVVMPIAIYCIFWSIVASPAAVFQTFFYEVFIVASLDWYTRVYLFCWHIALVSGPILFLCWPLTLAMLFDKNANSIDLERKLFTIYFASIFLAQFILYKQPFPYNFVFVVPAFFLLYSQFFSWFLASIKQSTLQLSILSLFFLTGILCPLYLTLNSVHHYNGDYQREMMRTVDTLTNDGSYYVAGIPLLYQKDQPIRGMMNLIGPQIDYLDHPTEKLAPVLFPSVYLAKVTQFDVIRQFNQTPVKYILPNSRTDFLPTLLLSYIKDNYTNFYSGIFIYGPLVLATQSEFKLNFSGEYRMTNKAIIDGKNIAANQLVYLTKGAHSTQADISYRVVLVPDIQFKRRPGMKEDALFKAIIY